MMRIGHAPLIIVYGLIILLLLVGMAQSGRALPVTNNLVVNYTWADDDQGDNGNRVMDSSGMGNNGLSIRTERTLTENNSFYREFINDSTYISTDPFTRLDAPYTIEWYGIVDSDADMNSKRILCDLGTDRGSYPIFSPNYLDTGKPAIFLNSHNYKLGSTDLRDGKPHQVIFVVTGSGRNDIDNATIYVDGIREPAYTVDKSGPAIPPAAKLHIGSGDFEGKTYLFRIYGMAFNQSQATGNYNDCRGRAGRSLQGVIDDSVAKTGSYAFTREYDGRGGGYTLYLPSNAAIYGNGKILHNISLTVKNSNNVTIRDVTNSRSKAALSPFSVVGDCDGIAFIGCRVDGLRTGMARTSGFYVLPSLGSTISHVTFKDCHVNDSDCYGFSLWGYYDGARNIDHVYFMDCTANMCGYYASTDNFTVGFDLGEDANNLRLKVTDVLVENCTASNCCESGFHMESGAIASNITISDSRSYNNGVRPSAKYGSGFRVHCVRMNNCTAWNNSVAGYNIDHFPFYDSVVAQAYDPSFKAGSTLNDCTDIGSNTNLLIWSHSKEHDASGLGHVYVNGFTGRDAKENMVQINGSTNVDIVNFSGATGNKAATPLYLDSPDRVRIKNMSIRGGSAEAICMRDVTGGADGLSSNSIIALSDGWPDNTLRIEDMDDASISIGPLGPLYTYHVLEGGSEYSNWAMRGNSTMEIALARGTHHYTLASDSATLISGDIPATMNAGQSYAVSVTFRNDGNMAWSASDRFKLGAIGDSASGAALFGPDRLGLEPGTIVRPGEQYTWHFNMTAPTPVTRGTYAPSYGMIWEGHEWFGDTVNRNVTVVLPYDASVAGNTIPRTMHNGTNYSFTITMKNIGTQNWTHADGFMLGAAGSSDAALFGPDRLGLEPGTIVRPGEQYTWHFNATAPDTIGKYYLSYRMVRNGQNWLGQAANGTVWVTDSNARAAYTVSLKKGWNLISIPLALPDDNIDHLFPDGEKSHILVVWSYDEANGRWYFYTPQTGYDTNTLSTIDTRHGYWIDTDEDVSFRITGTLPDTDPEPLSDGWSLVGNPALYVRDVTGVYRDSLVVWGYKDSQWYFYTPQPGYDTNTLHSLDPGYGYWVCMG